MSFLFCMMKIKKRKTGQKKSDILDSLIDKMNV